MNLTKYKYVAVALAVFAVSACASGDPATPSPSIDAPDEPTPTPAVSSSNGVTRVVIHLSPVQGEGQIGSATLTSDGTTTTVEIDVAPITGEAQPVHIHVGKCEDVGSVLHALQNVVNGKSMTTLNLSLNEILTGDVLVNVHASYADPSNYTACGQLPAELP
ncbi:MAG: hypothetical protein J4N79_11560 [Chloroflexi bacterium]|nr:hypothetical protein [Chloroflexota bacterium]